MKCIHIQALSILILVSISGLAVSAPTAPAAPKDQTRRVFRWDLEKSHPANPYIQQGFLPVTEYGADPTGVKDSSEAIQKTIDEAYENNLACFFPSGTYLVSRQLVCRQPKAFMTQAHVLIGSFEGNKRPVIKLADASLGFADSSKPNAVVFFQAVNNAGREDVPSCYNQCFRGIDLDLGSGNDGAVGVYMHGAQGCTIEDVKISAKGNFHAGIQHMLGSGGGYQNIEVIGGKHAIDAANDRSKHPLIAGLTAINQSAEVIKIGAVTPITIAGLYVEKEQGPCFVLQRAGGNECNSHLSLIDAVIKYKQPGQTAIHNVDRSVYLNNVYVYQASEVVHNDKAAELPKAGIAQGWCHVKEYSFYHRDASRLINDGKPESNNPPIAQVQTSGIAEGDVPQDMVLRHVWDQTRFPQFEAENVIDVEQAPYAAKPSDGEDDTEAIQKAIDDAAKDGKTVFLPKGEYLISGTLLLHKNTRLIGVSRNLTIISCMPSWKASANTPMIDTDDDADATTVLAFLRLEMPNDLSRRIYFTRWRAGQHSFVREVWFEKGYGIKQSIEIAYVLITGNGGGRWYNMFHRNGQADSLHPKHRYLLVQGTHEPLNIYTYCPEYSLPEAEYQCEFIDSKNICLFGLKCETHLKKPAAVSLGINNCQNVLVPGNTGTASAQTGDGIIEVKGSNDITLANLARWSGRGADWYYALNLDTGKGILESETADKMKDNNTASLFKIGDCVPVAIRP